MHLYAWLLPNVRLKGKNFIDICLIYKEIIKNIFLSRLLETGLFEKKKKDLTVTSLAYSPDFSCHFVGNIFVRICMTVLF